MNGDSSGKNEPNTKLQSSLVKYEDHTFTISFANPL